MSRQNILPGSKFKWQNTEPELEWLREGESMDMAAGASGLHGQPGRSLWESISYNLRRCLALVICLFIPVLWYVNQQLSALADYPKKSGLDLLESRAPASAAPLVPPSATGESGFVGTGITGLTDYIASFKASSYGDQFSTAEISALYHTGLTMDYLEKLDENGYLKELTFPGVIALFKTGVTLEYLNQMKEDGYLELFSYPAIAAFYNHKLPVDFLQELKEKNQLQSLSFTDVLVMFKNQ